MKEKILALSKAFLTESADAKTAFAISLAAPALFFLAGNIEYIGKTVPIKPLILGMSQYLAYILITSVWNFICIPLAEMREAGTLKQITFVTGSFRLVLLSDMVVQFFLILLESILFSLIVQLVVGSWNIKIIILAAAGAALLTPFLILVSTVALRIKLKMRTINVGFMLALILFFSLSTINSNSLLISWILLMNPVKFVQVGFKVIGKATFGFAFDVSAFAGLMVVALLYTIVGMLCIHKINYSPLEKRT